MLLLRFAATSRWLNDSGQPHSPNDPAAILNASDSFSLRDGEAGLSLYSVPDEAEAQTIAALFALTQRTKPDKVSYLLVDESIFHAAGAFTLNYDNPQDLPPPLSLRHCNQRELSDPTFRLNLVSNILSALADASSPRAKHMTITKATLISLIKADNLHLDPTIKDHIRDKPLWVKALK